MVNLLLRAAACVLPLSQGVHGDRGWLGSSPGQHCNKGPPPAPAAFMLCIKQPVISGKRCIKSWIFVLFLGGEIQF